MNRLQKINKIKDAAYELYENAFRLAICIEEDHTILIDQRLQAFSQSASDMSKELFELLEAKGFELKKKNDDLNDFLNRAAAEATAAGQHWE